MPIENVNPNKSSNIGPNQLGEKKENLPNLGKPSPRATEALKRHDGPTVEGRSFFDHKVEKASTDPNAPHVSESSKKDGPLTSEERKQLEALVGAEALEKESPDDLLFKAASSGDAEAVRLLIKLGADLNKGGNRGNTPLHVAAEAGHTEVVKLLLEQPGINLNATNRLQQTPLHLAASKGRAHIVKLMLATNGIDVSAKDRLRGATPLHLAALAGHNDVVKCFVEAKKAGAAIDFGAVNKHGETALTLAIDKGKEDVAITLIESGLVNLNKANYNGHAPLHRAAASNNVKVVEAILKSEQPVDVNQGTDGGQTPLHIAAEKGHAEMVSLLTGPGKANVNAIDLGHTTPLFTAAMEGHAGVIAELMKVDSLEINASDKNGNTPLLAAASLGHEDAVKLLLTASDIQPGALNTSGMSPLSMAKIKGHDAIAKLISEATDPKREALIHETKLMGHRFNLDAIDKQSLPDYNLEGYMEYYTNRELASHWNTFIDTEFVADVDGDTFWKDNQADLKEHFAPLNEAWSDTRAFDGEKVAQAIAAGTPCSIPGNFPEHYISMSIDGDVLCINNRGFQTQEGGGINETTVGLRFINIANHKEVFTEDFVNRLNRGDVHALRRVYEMPVLHQHERKPQKRGNCTLAQAKEDRQAHLAYFAAKKMGIDLTKATEAEWKEVMYTVEPLYSDFVLSDRAEAIERYATLDTNIPYHAAILEEGQNEMARLAYKQDGFYNISNGGGMIIGGEEV